MTYDVSTHADLALAGEVVRVLVPLADACGVPLLLVGAAARDVVVTAHTGAPPARATNDVDIAVAVASWEDFRCLTRSLARQRSEHAFLVNGIEVDVVPFGGVEDDARTIRWPDDHVMTVLGFAEALAHAVTAVLPGEVAIPVPSLAAQVVLKLVAWRDRGHVDGRDAVDLLTLLRAYGDGTDLCDLYDNAFDSLERHDFDAALAGADWLGHQVTSLLAAPALDIVRTLVERECSDEGALPAAMGIAVERNRRLLYALREGLRRPPGR